VGRGQIIAVGKGALLLVIAFVLHALVASQISVLGVTADTFLIFTVVVGISLGSIEGAIFGFIAGVVADIAFMQPAGLRSLVYVLTGYFVGMLVLRLGRVSPWGVLLVAGGASFFAQLLYGIAQYLMGPRAGFLTVVGVQMVPEAVLDGLVAVPVYVLLARLRLVPSPHGEPATARSISE
jgi:rod shape-determining protein MreD